MVEIDYHRPPDASPAPATRPRARLGRSALIGAAVLLIFARPGQAQEEFQLLGDAEAPVELTVYFDFECPACRNFALVALPAIKAEFVETGLLRLRLIFYPLSTKHPNAVAAASAAHCAGKAGRFWAYHDYLYVRQPEWRGTSAPDSLWVGYADKLGLDPEAFAACLGAKETLDAVEANWVEAISAGAPGTPTVLLNGESISDLGSYEQLSDRIRAAVRAARGETASAQQR